MIKQTALITNEDPNVFYEQLGAAIDQMQDGGLKVEVQYQQSNQIVSALIIGRSR